MDGYRGVTYAARETKSPHVACGVTLVIIAFLFLVNNAIVLGNEQKKPRLTKSGLIVSTSSFFLALSIILFILGIVYAATGDKWKC